MRLLQSVLATSPQTKKPQRKFIAHLLGLLLMLPGHATFRNLSRYSSYHERTFARWYDRHFDFVSLNKAAITQVIPPDHQQALVIDASFIPKSGTRTYGLERFWNSCHRRSEKGLEVSLLAWLDITGTCAYGLSVEQTPPSDKTAEPQGTRIDAYLEQLRHVVCDHHLKHLRYVIADGYYSKRKFLDGVRALGLHQMGKLRRDANLRYLYLGVGHQGVPRPMTARSSGTTCHALSGCTVKTTVLFSIIKSSTTCIFGATCVSCLWWIPALSGERCCSAPIPTWMRRRFIVGTKRASRSSFLQRRQTVYVSECLSSALAGQAACSLQCQHECSDLGQTGSATAKRRCPDRLFHGQPQTARLQPTSAGANFSAFSPGAEPGKIQPRLPRPL